MQNKDIHIYIYIYIYTFISIYITPYLGCQAKHNQPSSYPAAPSSCHVLLCSHVGNLDRGITDYLRSFSNLILFDLAGRIVFLGKGSDDSQASNMELKGAGYY